MIIFADDKPFKGLSPTILNDILPKDQRVFYRYHGSLTTPGCPQTVTWTIFHDPITISQRQVRNRTLIFFGIQ